MQTACTQAFKYRRHEPEATLLYQVLAREWETWQAERQADTSRTALPAFVAAEVDAYFRCGILDHGFTILSCDDCDEKLPVAYSCKRRGVCPSCCAKRMSEIAVHLVDNVLPMADYRQWVTTFPFALRYWMAASRKLTGVVHRLVTKMIQLYYTHKAEERGIKSPVTGGVTFVQRFGSALNLNVHFHTVAIDGVYSVAGPEPVFFQLPGPTDEEVEGIVGAVANVIMKELSARGYLPSEGDDSEVAPDASWIDGVFAESEQLAAAVSASSMLHVAFGERAGRKVRRIGKGFGWEDDEVLPNGRRCFSVHGFTIHANRYIGRQERGALEKLLAYGARGAFSHQRLSLCDPAAPSGDLVYTLKARWRDGTEAIRLSPSEFIEKLVALVPPPYVHLSRYFGVLSSHSKWRRAIVLRPQVKKGFIAIAGSTDPVRLTWSRLLARVFAVDISVCPGCGSRIRPESVELVDDPVLVARILLALGLYGRAPARAPPRTGVSLFDDIDQCYDGDD
jgi:hypothetical protein